MWSYSGIQGREICGPTDYYVLRNEVSELWCTATNNQTPESQSFKTLTGNQYRGPVSITELLIDKKHIIPKMDATMQHCSLGIFPLL